MGCSDSGGGSSEQVQSNQSPSNQAPVITSAANVDAAENQSVAYTIQIDDPDDTVFSVEVSGTDANAFSVNLATLEISFVEAPNFEMPADENSDGTYLISVSVSDGEFSDVLELTIRVTDVVEDPPFANDDDLAYTGPIGDFTLTPSRISFGTNGRVRNPVSLSDGRVLTLWGMPTDDFFVAIFASIISPDGVTVLTDFMVNETTTGGFWPIGAVARPSGAFSIVWHRFIQQNGVQSSELYMRSYNSEGESLGPEIKLDDTAIAQDLPSSVTRLENDNIVIAWHEVVTEFAQAETFTKFSIFDPDGVPVVTNIEVGARTRSSLNDPFVIGLQNGGFLVLRVTGDYDEAFKRFSTARVVGKIYDSTGSVVVDEFNVSENRYGDISEISASEYNENIIAIWNYDIYSAPNNKSRIMASIVDNSGNVLFPNIEISEEIETTGCTLAYPQVLGQKEEGFTAFWKGCDNGDDGISDIGVLRTFTEDTAPLSNLLSYYTGINELPIGILQMPNKTMLTSFLGLESSSESTYEIAARFINADGSRYEGYTEDRVIILTLDSILSNDVVVGDDIISVQSIDEISQLGATVSLFVDTDGQTKISYDPTSASELQSLADGESAIDSFNYVVVDDDNESSSAVVSLTIEGRNEVAP